MVSRGSRRGSNQNGPAMSYMGMAMNTVANAMGGFSNNNMEQMDKKSFFKSRKSSRRAVLPRVWQ